MDEADTEKIVQKLKKYFGSRDDVMLAFVFGSRAEGRARETSDWDIGIYFKPKARLELETKEVYASEDAIRNEVPRLTGAESDIVVLNRARPALVFDVLNSGLEIVNTDETLYLELLSKTHYEAVDYWNFVKEFWDIRKQAASLSPKARALLIEHVTFLENELADLEKFKKLSWKEYSEDRSKRRDVERWVENVVMSTLDIAKIILASEKKDVPQTYRDTLRDFAVHLLRSVSSDEFASFADLRNIIAHEYLDMRWERIRAFVEKAGGVFPAVLAEVKALLK